MISRYAVYWVDLNPVVGSEPAKRRPAVVISDNEMNRRLKTVVVCPLTSTAHPRWSFQSRLWWTEEKAR